MHYPDMELGVDLELPVGGVIGERHQLDRDGAVVAHHEVVADRDYLVRVVTRTAVEGPLHIGRLLGTVVAIEGAARRQYRELQGYLDGFHVNHLDSNITSVGHDHVDANLGQLGIPGQAHRTVLGEHHPGVVVVAEPARLQEIAVEFHDDLAARNRDSRRTRGLDSR